MDTKTGSPDMVCNEIFDFERPRFFATFPNLAPAVAQIVSMFQSFPKRSAIDCFLLAFCRLFEKKVSSDDDRPIPHDSIGKILNRMCSAGHTIKIKGRARSFAALYRNAVEEAGNMAPTFRQEVTTMYVRLYSLN